MTASRSRAATEVLLILRGQVSFFVTTCPCLPLMSPQLGVLTVDDQHVTMMFSPIQFRA
jgi:hypothetical protein